MTGWPENPTLPADAEMIVADGLRDLLPAGVDVATDMVGYQPGDTRVTVNRTSSITEPGGRQRVLIETMVQAPDKGDAWDTAAAVTLAMQALPSVADVQAVTVARGMGHVPVDATADGTAAYSGAFYVLTAGTPV